MKLILAGLVSWSGLDLDEVVPEWLTSAFSNPQGLQRLSSGNYSVIITVFIKYSLIIALALSAKQ